jgi:hypothetical protein
MYVFGKFKLVFISGFILTDLVASILAVLVIAV